MDKNINPERITLDDCEDLRHKRDKRVIVEKGQVVEIIKENN